MYTYLRTWAVVLVLGGIALMQCSPKTVIINNTAEKTEQTDECTLKDEICAEAADFQKVYNTMPEEEKKDMLPVLNSYIQHCQEAQKRCEKSNKK